MLLHLHEVRKEYLFVLFSLTHSNGTRFIQILHDYAFQGFTDIHEAILFKKKDCTSPALTMVVHKGTRSFMATGLIKADQFYNVHALIQWYLVGYNNGDISNLSSILYGRNLLKIEKVETILTSEIE